VGDVPSSTCGAGRKEKRIKILNYKFG